MIHAILSGLFIQIQEIHKTVHLNYECNVRETSINNKYGGKTSINMEEKLV